MRKTKIDWVEDKVKSGLPSGNFLPLIRNYQGTKELDAKNDRLMSITFFHLERIVAISHDHTHEEGQPHKRLPSNTTRSRARSFFFKSSTSALFPGVMLPHSP